MNTDDLPDRAYFKLSSGFDTIRLGSALGQRLLKPSYSEPESSWVVAAYAPQDGGKSTLLENMFRLAENSRLSGHIGKSKAITVDIGTLTFRAKDMGSTTFCWDDYDPADDKKVEQYLRSLAGANAMKTRTAIGSPAGTDFIEHATLPHLANARMVVAIANMHDLRETAYYISNMTANLLQAANKSKQSPQRKAAIVQSCAFMTDVHSKALALSQARPDHGISRLAGVLLLAPKRHDLTRLKKVSEELNQLVFVA